MILSYIRRRRAMRSLALMAAANRKKRAERFSERARKGWATRRARG